MTRTPPAPVAPAIPRALPWILLLLTVFGPFSMDLYLPALPALTLELEASTSVAQLTVTACLVGLAAGQLLAGPASDQHGRRRVLLAGVSAYVVTSLLCALSPSIELLIVARFVQGLAGGAGIVIAQAAGRDVFEGRELIRFYGRLAVAGPTAAIVSPVIGGLLNAVVPWRGLFGFLALVGVVLLVLTATWFTETLPPERRTGGGLGRTGADLRVLLADRVFVGAVLSQGMVFAAIFLPAGPPRAPGDHGRTPQWYAAAFALNSPAGAWVARGAPPSTAGARRAFPAWAPPPRRRGPAAVRDRRDAARGGARRAVAAGLRGAVLSPARPPRPVRVPADGRHRQLILAPPPAGFGGVAAPFVGLAGSLVRRWGSSPPAPCSPCRGAADPAAPGRVRPAAA